MKKSIKTEWNFKLLYKSDTDPQIEKDIKDFESAVKSFETKYKSNTDYLKDPKKLLKALSDYEKLSIHVGYAKPQSYFYYRSDIDASNKIAKTKINEFSGIFSRLSNRILFFDLNLGKVSKKQQDIFLKDKSLEGYRYFLKVMFEKAKYDLDEKEEKILNLLKNPSQEMWINGFGRVLNSQEVIFKGKTMPINEAMGIISELKTKDRRDLSDLINKKLIEISDFAESEINAVVTKKKITDELRGYEKPYSSVIKRYENEDKTIENLVDVVTNNFKIGHRFYKIKSKLLKEKKLQYADRGARVGESKAKFDLNKTVDILRSAFNKFDPKYKNILDAYLKNGQIDVYSKKGKEGGAYCSSNYGLPTFVLLNHTDTLNSIMTLAHEMGHAFHSELSHSQKPLYTNYTMSVAEVASTFFENFVFDEIFESLSEGEKVIALHNKINDSISTVFRQIACFNFEKELHETIRKNGYISKEDIAKIMNKHMKSYLGPVFDLKDSDGYYFVSWGHIRRFFYVYSYAFGEIISNALYSEYKKDPSFKDKVEEFLSTGNSKSPEDIFGDIGIDIRNPEFFKKGLKQIEDDIKRLERLVG